MTDKEPKILLFGPKTGKHLTRMYPELAKNDKLKKLPADDILFAWYVGCESSPTDKSWSDHTIYQSSALASIKDEEKKRKYSQGQIPEAVREGIEIFRKFNPDVRIKAKKLLQKMMYDYEQYVDIDIKQDFWVEKTDKEGNVTKEMDWAARKQYVDGTEKIMKNMPLLISQLEEGFGITEEKEKEKGTKMIDKFHTEKRES